MARQTATTPDNRIRDTRNLGYKETIFLERHPMLFRTIAISATMLISACTTISLSNRTIALSQGFVSDSTRIEAITPIRRYRDSFFDLTLGDFNVEDTVVSDLSKSKVTSKADKTVNESNSLWNLLVNRKIKFENITYAQSRYEESRDYSFKLLSSDKSISRTKCTITTLTQENNEMSRISINVLNNGVEDKSAKANSKWLSTRTSCSTEKNGMVLEYSKWDVLEKPSQIEFEPSTPLYYAATLTGVYTDEPRQAIITDAAGEQPKTDGRISGVAIHQGERQLAAASLVTGNNALWVHRDIPETEQAILVSALYGLILGTWIGE